MQFCEKGESISAENHSRKLGIDTVEKFSIVKARKSDSTEKEHVSTRILYNEMQIGDKLSDSRSSNNMASTFVQQ